MVKTRKTTYEDRFWKKVNKNGPVPAHCPWLGPCWVWTGARQTDGRGFTRFQHRIRKASVVAYILTFGEIDPTTPHVLHRCDGGYIACVRPDHLFLGTHQTNMSDMANKGRKPQGEKCGHAKLKDVDVKAIRARLVAGGITQRELSIEYGIAQGSISNVVRRKTWRHI